MTDFILFIRAYRKARYFGYPFLWTIKAAWRWRKPTPELIETYKTTITRKVDDHG